MAAEHLSNLVEPSDLIFGLLAVDAEVPMSDDELQAHSSLGVDVFSHSMASQFTWIETNLNEDNEVYTDQLNGVITDGDTPMTDEVGSSSVPQTPTKTTPVVKPPSVGMSFNSVDQALDYYKQYGQQGGFEVRIRTRDKKEAGTERITSYLLVCAREGSYDCKSTTTIPAKRRNTSTQKYGCLASMRVSWKRVEQRYVVTSANNEHNHGLVSPSKFSLMKVNKNMPEAAKDLTMLFHDEGLPISKVVAIFGGGVTGFSAKDCQNHFGKTRKNPKKGDATSVLNYFMKMHLENPDFRYAIQTDDEGRAVNFFWVDGRCRVQYDYFGYVVVFDTTYRTNTYVMPFASFTGVNHHLQSIQFGCALLLDETESTFVWLFETWLKAMGGRHPTSILTDQDKAMGNAVARVFPHTRHRLCLWHITSKIPEKFSHVIHKNESFTDELKLIVSCTYRISDFEEQWKAFMLKYGLVDNVWVKDMYEMRERWVPVFHLDTFFAGMNTTGRSESMNSLYDKFVNSNTTLTDFVHGNERLLEGIASEENKLDYKSEHTTPIVSKSAFLLKHASEVYTKNVYDKFLKQWKFASTTYKIDPNENVSNGYTTYTLRSRNNENPNYWKVNINTTTMEGECECKYFQFMGIPCGHLLKVFLRHDVDQIPNHFILARWKQRANTYRTMFDKGLVHGHEDSQALRSIHCCRIASELALDASTHDETYTYCLEKFKEISLEIEKRKAVLDTPSQVVEEAIPSEVVEEAIPSQVVEKIVIENPNVSQTKGRKPVASTIKRGIEKSQESKKRECKLCMKVLKQRVYGHDTRNCIYSPNRRIK